MYLFNSNHQIYHDAKAFPVHRYLLRLEALQERLDINDALIKWLY